MTDPGKGLKKDLTAEEFDELRDWIHRTSGIYLDAGRLDPFRISLATRATRLNCHTHADYFELLKYDEDEFKELMNLVTINETSFFRFPAQFDALSKRVVPEILEHKSKMSHTFRAWSAGCSTGEEPYSIAMSLLGSSLLGAGYTPEVLGTDVSTQALDRARDATYGARALSSLSQNVVQEWFEPVPGGHRPVARVRQVVDFAYHNLIKEPYPLTLVGNWDVIFCRNVTIYFQIESTRRVVNNFFDSLNPGGYLFIGHSETLTSISDRFEVVEVDGVFLHRKPQARRVTSFSDVLASREKKKRTGVRPPATAPASRPRVARLAPAPVVETSTATSAELQSKKVADSISRAYMLLEQGRPSEARQAADEALELNPESVEALIVRAYTHADDGDMDSAIEEAGRIIKIDPLVAPAHYILGLIHLRQGDQEAAIGSFKRTIYVDRDFVLANFNLANLYKSRGAFEEACREYRNTLASLKASPDGPWTAFLGGFRADLLAQTCERSLIECSKGSSRS